MSTEINEEDTRAELEREAERARARLLSTLDVLDRRRHDAFDVKLQVHKHLGAVASVAAGIVVVAGGAVAISAIRASSRRRHKGRARMQAFARMWRNPERAAKYQPRSVMGEVMRKAVIAAAALVAVEVAKRVMRAAVVEPMLGPATPEPHDARPLPPPVRIDEARVARIR
jgi:cell division ATPase FtsA